MWPATSLAPLNARSDLELEPGFLSTLANYKALAAVRNGNDWRKAWEKNNLKSL
jgi:hypothetical protein